MKPMKTALKGSLAFIVAGSLLTCSEVERAPRKEVFYDTAVAVPATAPPYRTAYADTAFRPDTALDALLADTMRARQQRQACKLVFSAVPMAGLSDADLRYLQDRCARFYSYENHKRSQ